MTASQKTPNKSDKSAQTWQGSQPAQEELNHLLMEYGTESISRHDLEGRYLYVSPACLPIVGYTPDELLGKRAYDLILPEDLPTVTAYYNHLLDAPSQGRVQYRLRHKNGGLVWVDSAAKLVIDSETNTPVELLILTRKMDTFKKADAQLHSLTARLSEVEEAERARLARELHDRVGQNLTALSINLNILQSMVPSANSQAVRPLFTHAQELVEQTAAQIRDVMGELRPSVLDDYGLVAALRWYGDKVGERVGITITVNHDLPHRLPAVIELPIFRILQEALTNVIKHTQAKHVVIDLNKKDDFTEVAMTDDGSGFIMPQEEGSIDSHGWGLSIMKERAEAFGATLDIESKPGEGTKVTIKIPDTR